MQVVTHDGLGGVALNPAVSSLEVVAAGVSEVHVGVACVYLLHQLGGNRCSFANGSVLAAAAAVLRTSLTALAFSIASVWASSAVWPQRDIYLVCDEQGQGQEPDQRV